MTTAPSTATLATATPAAWLSNTQTSLAYDCARAWQGVYRIGARPIEGAHITPQSIGKLGHLHLQHALAPILGVDWATRVAHLEATEPGFRWRPDDDSAATVAAGRVLRRLAAAKRVPAADADGPLVERLVRVPWLLLARTLWPQAHDPLAALPPSLLREFAGMEGRLDLVDYHEDFLPCNGGSERGDVDWTIRDFKFTQKAVGDAADAPSSAPDRQLATYLVLLRADGFDVREAVQTIVDARPMLMVDDYLAPGSALVRADGLPNVVAKNVEATVYLEAWDALDGRRTDEQRGNRTRDTAETRADRRNAEIAERDRHADLLHNIERVREVPRRMSWGVAREVVIDALHTMDARLRESEAGRHPANHRSHDRSPCNGWCPMRRPCQAATGLASQTCIDKIGPGDYFERRVMAFEVAVHDAVCRGEYESREQRRARLAATEDAWRQTIEGAKL